MYNKLILFLMILGFRNYKFFIFFLAAIFVSGCNKSVDYTNKSDVPYRNAIPRVQAAPYNPYYYPPVQVQTAPAVQPIIPSYGYQQPAPASRYYSNPYAAAPVQAQIPYYDSDQYYVAPSYYGTVDIDVPDAGFEKF